MSPGLVTVVTLDVDFGRKTLTQTKTNILCFVDLSGTQYKCLNKKRGPAVWVSLKGSFNMTVKKKSFRKMPSFVENCQQVPEWKIFEAFYYIWIWRPPWSCGLDYLYIHWSPLAIDASYKIWLLLGKRFYRKCGRTHRRTHALNGVLEKFSDMQEINLQSIEGTFRLYFTENLHGIHLYGLAL